MNRTKLTNTIEPRSLLKTLPCCYLSTALDRMEIESNVRKQSKTHYQVPY